MTPQPITAADFDAALGALGWKGSDFCARAGLVPNTVWRWRKGLVPIPLWVGEYLRALLAIQQLHAAFVAPASGRRSPGVPGGEEGPADEPSEGGSGAAVQ